MAEKNEGVDKEGGLLFSVNDSRKIYGDSAKTVCLDPGVPDLNENENLYPDGTEKSDDIYLDIETVYQKLCRAEKGDLAISLVVFVRICVRELEENENANLEELAFYLNKANGFISTIMWDSEKGSETARTGIGLAYMVGRAFTTLDEKLMPAIGDSIQAKVGKVYFA